MVLGPDLFSKTPDLAQRLLTLNNDHAVELSWLEPDRLADLTGRAFVAMGTDDGCALLLSFDQDAGYDSPNFLWFRDRFDRFVYVDRVVVSQQARGRGLARRLYETLFAQARAAGHDRVVCEINADPPNPASDAFHARLGFVAVGTGSINGGTKAVRYVAKQISDPGATVRAAIADDIARVIALWQAAGLTRPWNDPDSDFAGALAHPMAQVLIAERAGEAVGTIMVGYDGHRGWLYYLGVAAPHAHQGIGRLLVRAAEDWLCALGCPKVMLMVRSDNVAVAAFYASLGYDAQAVTSFGRRLDDQTQPPPSALTSAA